MDPSPSYREANEPKLQQLVDARFFQEAIPECLFQMSENMPNRISKYAR